MKRLAAPNDAHLFVHFLRKRSKKRKEYGELGQNEVLLHYKHIPVIIHTEKDNGPSFTFRNRQLR